jgi:hypothetical protein
LYNYADDNILSFCNPNYEVIYFHIRIRITSTYSNNYTTTIFVIKKNISLIQKTLDKKEAMDRSLGYPFLEIGPTTKNTIYFRLLFSVWQIWFKKIGRTSQWETPYADNLSSNISWWGRQSNAFGRFILFFYLKYLLLLSWVNGNAPSDHTAKTTRRLTWSIRYKPVYSCGSNEPSKGVWLPTSSWYIAWQIVSIWCFSLTRLLHS